MFVLILSVYGAFGDHPGTHCSGIEHPVTHMGSAHPMNHFLRPTINSYDLVTVSAVVFFSTIKFYYQRNFL
jgi:hypothetical protein